MLSSVKDASTCKHFACPRDCKVKASKDSLEVYLKNQSENQYTCIDVKNSTVQILSRIAGISANPMC